jgi:hypothetical protein
MRLSRIAIFILLLALSSCSQKNSVVHGGKNLQTTTRRATPTIKSMLVDYKSDSYKIAIGENYHVSNKVIEWNWSYLEDDDEHIDSLGKDAFLYTGEPLIRYNDEDYLPTLHIETDNNIITAFTCNVVFDLEDSSTAIDHFLQLLSNDIKKLKNTALIQSIKSKGHYEITTADYVEMYELKKFNDYNHIFTYSIKAISDMR